MVRFSCKNSYSSSFSCVLKFDMLSLMSLDVSRRRRADSRFCAFHSSLFCFSSCCRRRCSSASAAFLFLSVSRFLFLCSTLFFPSWLSLWLLESCWWWVLFTDRLDEWPNIKPHACLVAFFTSLDKFLNHYADFVTHASINQSTWRAFTKQLHSRNACKLFKKQTIESKLCITNNDLRGPVFFHFGTAGSKDHRCSRSRDKQQAAPWWRDHLNSIQLQASQRWLHHQYLQKRACETDTLLCVCTPGYSVGVARHNRKSTSACFLACTVNSPCSIKASSASAIHTTSSSSSSCELGKVLRDPVDVCELAGVTRSCELRSDPVDVCELAGVTRSCELRKVLSDPVDVCELVGGVTTLSYSPRKARISCELSEVSVLCKLAASRKNFKQLRSSTLTKREVLGEGRSLASHNCLYQLEASNVPHLVV